VIAGLVFLLALAQHPWFDIVTLAASERSAGKTYGAALRDAKTGARRWWCLEDPPAHLLDLPVEEAGGLALGGVDIVFSAVESYAARELEARYAETTPVLSTASVAFDEFGRELTRLELPSAPHWLITVHDDPFRPQPRLDRGADGGMTTSVGRIREDAALEHGVKYVLVSHNTRMGAAKGAVLTAEYLAVTGHV